jgi:hypothetical protein
VEHAIRIESACRVALANIIAPMSTTVEIELPIPDVQWAAETARSSLARWESQRGYYNNRLNSHFKGKLGELAVEKFLLDQNLRLDSHFRFADREALADIVVKIHGYKKVLRLEVKTWSRHYWQDLGRCISVEQFPDLKKKADIIAWCVTDASGISDTPVNVLLAGWSKMDEILKAPVKFTGLDNMRKVKNYQLAETDLRHVDSLMEGIQ